jgi:F420-non-reducing hydrogenase large subunit
MRVTIDPITRLEGHGRVDLFLDEQGRLVDSRLVVPEIRGFEKFLEGRPVEELPRITPRICGVCPEAHHTASAKAADAVYGVAIPETAEIIRRLQYNAFVAGDHATHFFALGGPDFIVGPDAPPAERNILGVIRKVGLETGKKVLRMRAEAHEVAEMLGGRRIHPVGMIPGGVSKGVSEEMQRRLQEIGAFMVDFSTWTRDIFHELVLGNDDYLAAIKDPAHAHRSYYMALVDGSNRVDHYHGALRVVSPDGEERARFSPEDYLQHLSEKVVPWSYLKIPFLKAVGWNGISEGSDSGLYRVAPLGMLNASEGMKTPLAQDEYDRMYEALGGRPAHATLAYHWARIIEMIQCSELVVQHAHDSRLVGRDFRVLPEAVPGEGVGVVEAPRGILLHHYWTDENGIVKRANLIVGTGHNHGALQISVRKAAEARFDGTNDISEPMLNAVEMAIRAYDPCFACASHALPGKLSLELRLVGRDGQILATRRRWGAAQR